MDINALKITLVLIAVVISSSITVTLPINPHGIPFSAQSLIIFVCAAFLKPKEFGLALIIYLVMGIAGLPVFAERTSGWSRITGPSGGFLWGFLLSGLFISCLITKSQSFLNILFIMTGATIVLFVCGLGQLTALFGIEKAIEYGFTPFWKMALFKAFIATSVVFFNNSIWNRDKKVRS